MGCIFAELILKKPLFPSESDIDQLSKIFGVLGTPTSKNWPGADKLPRFIEFQQCMGVPLKNLLRYAEEDEVTIIEQMLNLDPNKRPSCEEILQMEYFASIEPNESLVEIVTKATE